MERRASRFVQVCVTSSRRVTTKTREQGNRSSQARLANRRCSAPSYPGWPTS